jgi:hypothetical protein
MSIIIVSVECLGIWWRVLMEGLNEEGLDGSFCFVSIHVAKKIAGIRDAF